MTFICFLLNTIVKQYLIDLKEYLRDENKREIKYVWEKVLCRCTVPKERIN
jgi:hypothetical protein